MRSLERSFVGWVFRAALDGEKTCVCVSLAKKNKKHIILFSLFCFKQGYVRFSVGNPFSSEST